MGRTRLLLSFVLKQKASLASSPFLAHQAHNLRVRQIGWAQAVAFLVACGIAPTGVTLGCCRQAWPIEARGQANRSEGLG